MIAVARLTEPAILTANANNWKEEYLKKCAAWESNPTDKNLEKAKNNAEGKYNHEKIRAQLQSMFHGKCAYCESHIGHVSYDQIEHFRPKGEFRDLCFSWENLLLACGRCNDKGHKGEKFPEDADGGPFVNPAAENPDDFFDFVIDSETGITEVKPKNTRGHTTERELGLNRWELQRHRSKYVMLLFRLAVKAGNGDSDCKDLLLVNCLPNHEYAAFARSIADRFGFAWR